MRRSFRSIHFPPSPLPRATLHGCKLLKISSFNPTPPPLGLNLCSSAPPKLWTWSSIFSEKWPWHYFRTFVVSHLLAKVNCLPVNTSILKNKPLVFRSKDLKVPIQIPHPTSPHPGKVPYRHQGSDDKIKCPWAAQWGNVEPSNWSTRYKTLVFAAGCTTVWHCDCVCIKDNRYSGSRQLHSQNWTGR